MHLHPRLSLHQIVMASESTAAFVTYAREIGLAAITLNSPSLRLSDTLRVMQDAAPLQCRALCHPFTLSLDPAIPTSDATANLDEIMERAAALGVQQIYLITGGRGSLTWNEAAQRFAQLIAPCRKTAQAHGIQLLIETASPHNVDIHLCHTLRDTERLSDLAGLDICLELNACWYESDITENLQRLAPRIGLVQVSDYVSGDRTSPARAVPGDGMIPLPSLLQTLLQAGYKGTFDLELVGPRIAQEGSRKAALRGLTYVSDLLTHLGA